MASINGIHVHVLVLIIIIIIFIFYFFSSPGVTTPIGGSILQPSSGL